ncbi:alpha/beta fold hydrolase [Falsiphaeobacter marinintestinus]|uniref:alpha/beta fold hydrolase n=1 Tax=Falsiphaeobacter marinintestinus TaxID=1492905 RepID=UPI0011B35F5A|nr:alpha/beta hydrolase [Phaeobacter marinintestinus]
MDKPVLSQQVFSRTMGQGPRAVLAIHCSLAHSAAWRGVSGHLDKEATFIAFDMLTHGRSPDWDGQGDIQDRMTEIAAQFLTGPMDVIGHSFGATVALRLAAAYPDSIRSLTLIEPVFFAVAAQDAPDLLEQHERDNAPFQLALEAGDDAHAARVFNRMWSEGKSRWADMPETSRASMIRSIRFVPACRAPIYDDLAGLLKPGVLDRITAPCLLMRGGRSHPVIGAVNDGLQWRLPNAENVVIDGAGHMLPITHPRDTAGHLRSLYERASL